MQALNSHWLKWSAMDLSPVSVHFEFLLWCFSPDWHNSASSGLLCSARAVEGSFQVNVPHKGPEIGRLLHWRHKRISYQSRSQAPENNIQSGSDPKLKTTKQLILSRFWERNIICFFCKSVRKPRKELTNTFSSGTNWMSNSYRWLQKCLFFGNSASSSWFTVPRSTSAAMR